ncbi:MAG TPA: hypothetical protein VLB79_03730 [Solirubrobacterales bacterium]|nr:hypothetical protein [Solirubrobacterales bacterium]
MADGRPLIPRIRMPRITRPGRASRAASEQTTATKPLTRPDQPEKAGNGAEPATRAPATKAGAAAPAAEAAATPGTAKPGESATTLQPNLQERIEGLQGWMAEIERKQARLTYFGGLALLLALGAAGAALYFGLTAHSDSATKKDLDALTNRVNSLQGAVTKNSKDTQNALNASIAQLQQSIGNLQKQQAQAAANISTLQSQVASGALNKNAVTPGVTPTTPGAATTTTTPKSANGKTP